MKFPASKQFYEKAIRESEQWSRLIFIFVLIVLPICATTLLFGTTFFFYFVNDLDNDAFVLGIPMWYGIQSHLNFHIILKFDDLYYQLRIEGFHSTGKIPLAIRLPCL